MSGVSWGVTETPTYMSCFVKVLSAQYHLANFGKAIRITEVQCLRLLIIDIVVTDV
ncbi:TPA: hypothetical protein ACX6QF_000005 [Photobacterium damselae]